MSDNKKTSYRGYLIDHHSPDPPVAPLDKLDPAEWERFFVEANIDQLMLYTKDHWGSSYYDTKIGRKHPGLGDKDWVGQIVPILKKHNIDLTAYYCFEYDSYAPKAHPEWTTLTKDGIPMVCGMPTNTSNAKWGIPCLHTGYREYALGQLKEVISQYHPKRLFIDIFGMSLCYCDICKKNYRDRYGYDIPETPEDMMAKNNDIANYLDDEAEKMLDDVRSALKPMDPDLEITVNFAAHYPKQIRDKLDYLYTEPWAGNWLSGAFARDTSGGKYTQLGPGSVSKVFNYQPDTIYELASAEIAAQGCCVFLYSESMRVDGTLEFTEAQRIGKAYREVEKIEPWLENRQLQADIAIIQSDIADSLRVDQPIHIRSIGRSLTSGLHRKALLGAMQLCDYSKRTWCAVPELELTYEKMCAFKMILVPNLFYINDPLAADLRKYVQQGGIVLFTGECGVCDAEGKPLSDFALADLMGCHFEKKDETYRKNIWCAYVEQTDSPVWKYAAKTTPPVGPYILRTKPDGAVSLGQCIDPACLLTDTTWVNWGNPHPGLPNGQTAIYENTVGRGKVLTTCFDLCSMATEEFVWPKDFMLGVVEHCFRPSITLETDNMRSMEFTCYTRGEELLVHELSAMPRITGGDAPLMEGGILKIADSYKKVLSAEQVYPVQAPLAVTYEDGVAKVALPKVQIHNIYRIVTGSTQ